MQASASNGFQNTSIINCSGTPSTSSPSTTRPRRQHRPVGGAADQHQHRVRDRPLRGLHALYPTRSRSTCRTRPTPSKSGTTSATALTRTPDRPMASPPRPVDGFCYPKGDTHGSLHTGARSRRPAVDDILAGGDLDFDGQPYYADWPTGPRRRRHGPEASPSNGRRRTASSMGSSTSRPTSPSARATCSGDRPERLHRSAEGPGHFYPYWSESAAGGGCRDRVRQRRGRPCHERLRQGRPVRRIAR